MIGRLLMALQGRPTAINANSTQTRHEMAILDRRCGSDWGRGLCKFWIVLDRISVAKART